MREIKEPRRVARILFHATRLSETKKENRAVTKRLLLEGAPKRAGAYAHAVISDGVVYVSGQGPVDPQTGLVSSNFSDQVKQAMANMKFILAGADCTLADVIKVNAYLADLSNFEIYNDIFEGNFGEILPARTTIGCQLHGIMFEIDCVARKHSSSTI